MNRLRSWMWAVLAACALLVAADPSALAQSPFASGWVVAGNTTGGVTTFGAPVQYKAGVDNYAIFDGTGDNRWGDYSATTRDPTNPNVFWTIQEWASGLNQWSTQIAQVTVGAGNVPVITTNFTGSNIFTSGFIPPDTMGAVGPSHFTELINGNYAVYDKLGGLQVRTSLDAFWAAAGVAPVGGSFDPRILYDAGSGHWFATSLDFASATGGTNDILVAASVDGNPLNGWIGTRLPGDFIGGVFADFDTLGINADGVYISCNDFSPGFVYNTLTALDKATLIGGGLSGTQSLLTFADSGFSLQPVVNLDGGGGPEIVLAEFNTPAGVIKRSDGTVFGGFAGGPFIGVTPYLPPVDASQPSLVGIDAGDARISGNTLLVNGELWMTQTLFDGVHDAIRWARINPLTNTVTQEGLISDPNFDFYFPSVSVGPNGDVVIGFSGSSVVPEPGSWLLFSMGVLGLAHYARRRRGQGLKTHQAA